VLPSGLLQHPRASWRLVPQEVGRLQIEGQRLAEGIQARRALSGLGKVLACLVEVIAVVVMRGDGWQ
jgi:hypothetical protein